jgi:hypothetical protein
MPRAKCMVVITSSWGIVKCFFMGICNLSADICKAADEYTEKYGNFVTA